MAQQNMNLEMVLTMQDKATPALSSFINQLKKLKQEVNSITSAQTRMTNGFVTELNKISQAADKTKKSVSDAFKIPNIQGQIRQINNAFATGISNNARAVVRATADIDTNLKKITGNIQNIKVGYTGVGKVFQEGSNAIQSQNNGLLESAANISILASRSKGGLFTNITSGLKASATELSLVKDTALGKNIEDLTKKLQSLRVTANQSRESMSNFFKSVGGFALKGGALLGATGGLAGKAILEKAADFEQLRTALKTSVGSADVQRAFTFIQQMAQELPVSLEVVMQSFIKLQNQGITPTAERLRAFANISSAMAKPMEQFVEAVMDAAVGEFERLKEFGIRASAEGDKVKFTFKGVTTEIGRDSKDIVNYLTQIGNVQFAGAATDQMSTLKGGLSNLGDAVDKFSDTFARDTGLLDWAKEATASITDMISTITPLIGPYVERLKQTWSAFSDSSLAQNISGAFNTIKSFVTSSIDVFSNLSAYLQTLWVEVGAAWDKSIANITVKFKLFGDEIGNAVSSGIIIAVNSSILALNGLASAARGVLSSVGADTLAGKIKDIETIKQPEDKRQADKNAIIKEYNDKINAIDKEKAAKLSSIQAEVDGNKKIADVKLENVKATKDSANVSDEYSKKLDTQARNEIATSAATDKKSKKLKETKSVYQDVSKDIADHRQKIEEAKQAQQQLSQEFAAGKITAEEYSQAMRDIHNIIGTTVMDDINDDIANNRKLSKEAADVQQELARQYASGKISLEEYTNAMQGVNNILGTNVNTVYTDLTNNILEHRKEVESASIAQEKLNQDYAAGKITLDEYNEALQRTNEIIGDKEKEVYNKLNQEIQDHRDEVKGAQYAQKELETQLNSGKISYEEYRKAIKSTNEILGVKTKDAIDLQIESMQEAQDQMQTVAQGMQSAFSDFFFNPFKKGLKGLVTDLRDTITRMVAEIMAKKLVAGLFGGNLPGSSGSVTEKSTQSDVFGGGIGGIFSGLFGFASGGIYPAGRPRIVGERGPEIDIPTTGGTVLPNDALKSIGKSVNINITAMDSQDVMRALQKNKREISSMISGTQFAYNMR